MQASRETLWQEGFHALEVFLETAKRPLILHLSDTDTSSYAFARRILERVRPELTLHTGDMADEWKAGRIPAHVPRYRAAVPELLDAMEAFSHEVWITPGNNDVLSVLDGRDKLRVFPNGSRLEAFGVRMEIDHDPIPAAWDVDFAVYGHGPTDDLRYPLPDQPGWPIYLNGNYHWTLIEAASRRFVRIPFREPERCVRIFIARHGQTRMDGESDLPGEDRVLTRLGERQTRCLAEEMRRLCFGGRILCSSDLPTQLGADTIACATGRPIHLEPRLSERRMDAREESLEAVCERLSPLLNELLDGEGDSLILGSGAVVCAAVQLLMQKSGKTLVNCPSIPEPGDCSLSVFRMVKGVVHPLRLFSLSHMPLTMATCESECLLRR